jgi:hypothetical protein
VRNRVSSGFVSDRGRFGSTASVLDAAGSGELLDTTGQDSKRRWKRKAPSSASGVRLVAAPADAAKSLGHKPDVADRQPQPALAAPPGALTDFVSPTRTERGRRQVRERLSMCGCP